ncbi:MAG: hypothetical protein GT598_09710 [Bacteroidales bacterium]|nr:hypothetical protein [Bacteroidales bacterium]
MKFILSIDTEGDNQWDYGRELTTENIRYVPRFQDFCNKFKIKPTYLVTSEVCQDGFAREIFREYQAAGTAEIGAHLHSWTTPPFLDKKGYRFNDDEHPYASELPIKLLNDKIKSLTDEVEASFGHRPLSFRSGRYGFNETVAGVLIENSYIVDSSVTPFISWTANKGISSLNGGPDFSNMTPGHFEYFSGGKRILEIPVSIYPTRFPLNTSISFARYYFRNVDDNLLLKALRKFIYKDQPVWLRPFDRTSLNLFKDLVKEAYKLNMKYLVMMFHSSELMPGCSIYRKDEEAIEKLYILLTGFFAYLKDMEIESVTLTEAAMIHNNQNSI